MLIDVTAVKPLPDYKLWLQFEDGANGTVDFNEIVQFKGVFSALKNPGEFAKASVNAELGVVCWPNGADLDSDVLYAKLTGKPLAVRNEQE